jgi:hypothetical protein
MPTIYKHPAVEDYFKEIDCGPKVSLKAVSAEATKLYEDGKAILLRGKKLDYDQAFLSQVTFPNEEGYKKFKSVRFVKKGEAPADMQARCFNGDAGRMRYFKDQVQSINRQIDSFVEDLFPRYRKLRPSITWRMSDTINENLHFDVYKKDQPDHHLRLFVNIDSCPRIWHTSHTLMHLLDTSLHLLPKEFLQEATPGRLCHDLNFAVFGGFEKAGREGADKHIAFFEPGEVWLVDSRKVSHQIFFGRRAISTDHAIDVTSMQDPGLHYYALVEQARQKALG